MADDEDRRGDSNMAEAEKTDTSTDLNNTKVVNGSTDKPFKTQNDGTDVDSLPVDQAPAANGNAISEIHSELANSNSSSEVEPKATLDQLAKTREELIRAKAELAQARDDEEKLKLELAEAENDVLSSKILSDTNEALKKEEIPSAIVESPVTSDLVVEDEFRSLEPTTTVDVIEKSEVISQAVVDEPPVANTSVENEPSNNQTPEVVESAATVEEKEDGQDQKNETTPVVPKEADVKEDGEVSDENQEEENSDEEVVLEGEREEGDGEESDAVAKPLDDDEDRRNPQYIPKRGGFYEHDDRTREEDEEVKPTEEPEVEEKPKKGSRSEAIDRWGHDMFDESQQGPKSDQELVALYGYDIRVEEGAPRARRRRRYGRGPNKYDRTWEDEEAYSRPRPRGGASSHGGDAAGSRGGRSPRTQDGPPRDEDFPALGNANQEKPTEPDSPNWRDGNGKADSSKANAISFRRGGGGRTFEERNKSKMIKGRGENLDSSREYADMESPKDSWKSGKEDNPRGPVRGNNRAPRGVGMAPRGPDHSPQAARGEPSYRGGRRKENIGNWEGDQSRSSGMAGVATDYGRFSNDAKGRGRGKLGRITDKVDPATVGLQQLHINDQAPPRAQENRSKRYSSQRQRMTTPPPPPSGGGGGGVVMPSFVPSGNSSYYASYNASPPPAYVAPSNYDAPLLPLVGAQGAPPFIGPPMGYPAAPAAPYSAGFQGYSANAAPAVQVGVPIRSPTQDIYGAASGIMYYDPGRQPVRHGSEAPRRPKAAIPIVAPDNDVEQYIRRATHE